MNAQKIFLVAIVLAAILATVSIVSAQPTEPTIDGTIEAIWGSPTYIGSDYDVYVMNNDDYLYVAFEAEGGDYIAYPGMTNIYIYAGDDYAGECWAYTALGQDEVEGLTYFTTHHIQPPKVKEGQESRTTSAIVEASTLVMEWRIPLSEIPMSVGDTLAFDFMSFSEGSSSWDTAWLYEEEYTGRVLNERTGLYYYLIQAAVDAALADDSLLAYPDTYEENVFIPEGKDNLSIRGTSNENTFVKCGSGTAFFTNSPVTIKNFDISGDGRHSQGGTAISVRDTGSGCPSSASGTAETPGLFENNIVHDLNYGLKSADHCTEYWNFRNNEFYELRIGIGLENMGYVEITNNIFKDYKEGVSMTWGAGTAHHIVIADNEFKGSGGYPDDLAAIVISSAATDIQVLSNEIKDSIVGVLIKQKDDTVPDLTDVGIHFNNIVGNTEGVKNEQAIEDVDATCNWWGDASGPSGVGPGSGNTVSDNVIFSPWLISKDGPCLGGLPPLALKNHAKVELNSIEPTGDKKVDEGLEKAMKHLDNSMDEDLWVDAFHVAKTKVFDEEKNVVKELQKLIDKTDASQNVKDECQLIIEKLCLADGILASTAVDEAQDYAGDPKVDKELEKCEQELAKANEELAKGKYDKAIDHFKKAWEHAQNALKHAP